MHGGGHGKGHGHGHDHGHIFPFERANELESPKRQDQQPLPPLLEVLDLKPDSNVLDLGAGIGYFTLPIAQRLLELQGSGCVFALDIEPRMLDQIRQKAEAQGLMSKIKLLGLSPRHPEDLPLTDESVHRALLVNLYHELARPLATLQSVRRTLSPEGLLLLVDWDPNGRNDFGPPLDHRVSHEEVQRILGEAGFDSRRIPLYDNYYALLCRG
jgi:SAM-dependent methyltransferase